MKVSIDFRLFAMHIGRVTLVNGELVSRVVLDGQIQPVALARLANLMHQGAPLSATIYSPQAMLDLDLMPTVDVTPRKAEA